MWSVACTEVYIHVECGLYRGVHTYIWSVACAEVYMYVDCGLYRGVHTSGVWVI